MCSVASGWRNSTPVTNHSIQVSLRDHEGKNHPKSWMKGDRVPAFFSTSHFTCSVAHPGWSSLQNFTKDKTQVTRVHRSVEMIPTNFFVVALYSSLNYLEHSRQEKHHHPPTTTDDDHLHEKPTFFSIRCST